MVMAYFKSLTLHFWNYCGKPRDLTDKLVFRQKSETGAPSFGKIILCTYKKYS